MRTALFGIELEFFLLDRNGNPAFGSTQNVIREWVSRGLPDTPVPELGSFQIEINPGPWPLTAGGVEQALAQLRRGVDNLETCAAALGYSLCTTPLVPRITPAQLADPALLADDPRSRATSRYFERSGARLEFVDGTRLVYPGETVLACLNEIHIHVQLADDDRTLALFNAFNRHGEEIVRPYQRTIVVNGKDVAAACTTLRLFEEADGEPNRDRTMRRVGFYPGVLRSAAEYRAALATFEPIPCPEIDPPYLDLERSVWLWTRLRGVEGDLRVEFRPMEMNDDWQDRVRHLTATAIAMAGFGREGEQVSETKVPRTFQVQFQGGSFPVREGQSILDATRTNGVSIPHTCGGNGKCLTCRFDLIEGALTTPNRIEAGNAQKLQGQRLSCQNTPLSDLRIEFEGPVRIADEIPTGISWDGTNDGPEINVTPRPNLRLDLDRRLLVPAERAHLVSQDEMNEVLRRIAESDAEEIRSGRLKPAPAFESEGYTDDEYWASRRRERLLYFNLEFTNVCNLACTGCFAGFGDVKNVFETEEFEPGFANVNAVKSPLSLDELYGVIDQAADLGAKCVDLIGGGEPLSSSLFFPLAERAVERGMEVEVFTNGTLIDRKKAEHMAALKVQPYVKLYSTRSWVHDQMVGVKDAWKKVLAGIDHLMDAGYGLGGLPLALESIVVRKNLSDMPTMWRFARERGMIPYFERFVGCHYDGDPGELLSPMELKQLWEELWLLDRGEYGYTWPILPLRVGYSCLANFYSLYVNYEGDVRPCSGTFVPLGNTKQTTLKEILVESPVVKDLREYERPVDSWCASCYYYESDRCPGCRGMAQASGSYMADDPLCFHNPHNLTAAADPRNTPHLSKMPTTILKKYPGLFASRERLLSHHIYQFVDSVEKLRVFMEDHVFAVWDFMSIAKRLQRDLTCLTLPWTPPDDASLARFVNEIIHCEESDEGPDGIPASHLEIYLSAMREVGADARPFLGFIAALKAGRTPEEALAAVYAPKHVRDFVLRTLDVALNGTTVEVVADFLYSREDIIPEMFQRMLGRWDDPDTAVPTFKFYLERHIEVDGENHGPAARRMLERLVDDKDDRWEAAARAAMSGIESRISLWDGCVTHMEAMAGASIREMTQQGQAGQHVRRHESPSPTIIS